MNGIDLIRQDHRTVDQLFQRFESTEPAQAERRRELVEVIIRELSIHAAIEETVLYPEIREAVPGGKELVEEGLEEHQDAKETLNELDGMVGEDPQLEAKVRSLIGDVRHHVEEEEGEILPKLESALSSDRLQDLGARLERAKESAPTRPHPLAPSTPPANLVTGPAAGLVDRVRDVVTDRPARPTSRKTPATGKKTSARKSASRPSTTRKSGSTRKTTRKPTTKRSAASRSRTTGRGRTRGPVFHVTPAGDGGWRAEKAGSNRAVAKGDRKDEVVRQARQRARTQKGRLVIHGKNGRIQEERTYRPDPRRSRG
jgi:hemerythrin superfamily protein